MKHVISLLSFILFCTCSVLAQPKKSLTLKQCIHTYDPKNQEPNEPGWAYWFIPSGTIADTLSVKMSCIDKGLKTHDPHHHYEDELFVQIEGESRVSLNGEYQVLKPLDAFYAVAESKHNISRTDMNQPIRYVMFKREFKGRHPKPLLPAKLDYKMKDVFVPYNPKAKKIKYLTRSFTGGGLNVDLIQTKGKHKVKRVGEQTVYFLAYGEAEITLNGETTTIKALSSVYVCEGSDFSIKPVGKNLIKYMIVKTR